MYTRREQTLGQINNPMTSSFTPQPMAAALCRTKARARAINNGNTKLLSSSLESWPLSEPLLETEMIDISAAAAPPCMCGICPSSEGLPLHTSSTEGGGNGCCGNGCCCGKVWHGGWDALMCCCCWLPPAADVTISGCSWGFPCCGERSGGGGGGVDPVGSVWNAAKVVCGAWWFEAVPLLPGCPFSSSLSLNSSSRAIGNGCSALGGGRHLWAEEDAVGSGGALQRLMSRLGIKSSFCSTSEGDERGGFISEGQRASSASLSDMVVSKICCCVSPFWME